MGGDQSAHNTVTHYQVTAYFGALSFAGLGAQILHLVGALKHARLFQFGRGCYSNKKLAAPSLQTTLASRPHSFLRYGSVDSLGCPSSPAG